MKLGHLEEKLFEKGILAPVPFPLPTLSLNKAKIAFTQVLSDTLKIYTTHHQKLILRNWVNRY